MATMSKIKKWHIASAIAIVAIIVLIVVLVGRRTESRLSTCPSIPIGDPLTSYTQDSGCATTCLTTDKNATVAPDASGACRSTCNSGFVKSSTTGECTISLQIAQGTIDNLKSQLMELTDPLMKQQMSSQIITMQRQVDMAKNQRPVATSASTRAQPVATPTIPVIETASQPMTR